jgi:hypothetical protein
MPTKEIEEIIKSLKTQHSHGYDEIGVKILKLSALFYQLSFNTYIYICVCVCVCVCVCNKSFSSGIFLTRLKFSVVKPVFKNGDKISNYRPISLLNVFSKVFKKQYMQDCINT